MDIVLCVALKDIFILNKNLYFIKKNLNVDRIYVITDCRNIRYIKRDESIVLVDENNLLKGITYDYLAHLLKNHGGVKKPVGWYYQQMLKIGFALSSYAKDDYLVWDADTVPLNPIQLTENGKFLINPKKEHHIPYFETIDKLFQAPIKANYSFISEHMVFNVSIVREMVKAIYSSSVPGSNWIEKCINAIPIDKEQGFSEFETYGTYCLNYYPNCFKKRQLVTLRIASKLFGVIATRKEIESLSSDFDTASFEMSIYPLFFYRKCQHVFLLKICKLIVDLRMRYPNIPL